MSYNCKIVSAKGYLIMFTEDTFSDSVKHYPQIVKQKVDINTFDSFLNLLLEEVNFNQDYFIKSDKLIRERRLTALQSSTGSTIRYSNKEMKGQMFTPTVLKIKEIVENILDITFDTVLINYYKDGRDCMGWHSDDVGVSKGLNIATVSLGDSRVFQMRNKVNKEVKKNFILESGDLFHMFGDCQLINDHRVKENKKSCSPRISLTFRQMSC